MTGTALEQNDDLEHEYVTQEQFQNSNVCTRPRSAVGSESNYRSWGRELNPSPVPYFRG